MYARKWTSAVVFLAVMAWLVVGVLADPTEGEGGSDAAADKPAEQKIALLNVAEVMKNSTELKKQLADIQSDAKEIQAALKSEGEEIRRKMEHLKSLGSAIPNRDELEKEVTEAQALLQAKAALKERDLRRRETRAYNAAYDTMSKEAKEYAQANGFLMVFRTVEGSANDANQKEVISKLNRPVIWYDSKCDITSVILARMNAVDGPL